MSYVFSDGASAANCLFNAKTVPTFCRPLLNEVTIAKKFAQAIFAFCDAFCEQFSVFHQA
jgi:hypothetical protein